MSLEQDVAILKGQPIFAAFSDEQLRLVAFSAEPLELEGGLIVFEEGAPAVSGFLVVSGAVRLYSAGEAEPIDRGVFGPATLIGELALLCPTRRPATAETVERSHLRAIPRRSIRRVLEEYPELAASVRRSLSRRLAVLTSDLGRARQSLLALDPSDG